VRVGYLLLYRRAAAGNGRTTNFFSHESAMPHPLLGPSVRAVFFDAVGTLIHPDPSVAEVYHAVGRRFGSRLAQEEVRRRFRTAFHVEEVRDQQAGLRTSEEREVARWRSIVATVLNDVHDPAACFAELYDHFGRPEAWRCEPDAAETLSELARQGYTFGLASNYDHRLRAVVAGLAPLTPVRHLVISSEVGWRKPAPAFFAAVCTAVGLASEQIVFVGDDLHNDYEGARAAGLRTLLFDPERQRLEPRECIVRLRELVEGTSDRPA
jgi:putative hydrolase of the HAD superfamily